MKNVFKKIIPVLLTLLILVSIVWYCFVYDRNFTRDMLLSQARYLSTNGKPEGASWFYDTAYELSDQDENVAIELANQFKASGNFTKAEYTLSNAIADGGDATLYIALCKTYVQQDKLLDAVNMLDNIADPKIKAELDAMRPALPTSAPAPGFYNEYINVELISDDNKLYHSTTNEYPSCGDAPYADPISLPEGETIIRAVAVAENGLVSPLASFEYVVGGIIEEVTFSDSVIDASIREILNVDSDHVLFTNELWNITSYTVPEGAMNLQELAKLPYLQSLTISGQTFDSVAFLATLSHLEELSLTDCRFPADELEIISALPSLKSLTLSNCGVSTVAGLENAQNLIYLDLSNNTVRNLQPLSSLVKLQTLNLSHNALTDLADLISLTNLQKLDVSYNVLPSIDPIAACVKLTELNASHNRIRSLETIDNLSALSILDLSNNSLSDISILGNCIGLTELNLSKNAITDISSLVSLNNLEILSFTNNLVTSLPNWTAECKLRSIDGTYNQITSISVLKNLDKLTHIFMDYNELTNIDDVANCFSLVQINVYGNPIENVDALKEHEIIVNWDPTAVDKE